MGIETHNTRKLDDLLQPHAQEFNVLQEALKEVMEEDGEKRKDSAKSLIREAMSLRDRMEQSRRQSEQQIRKFDKQLGKMLNKLNAMVHGRPLPENDEDEDEGKDDSSGSSQD